MSDASGADDNLLNQLYTSKNPDDIMKFYTYFNTRDDLVAWMRKRPYADRVIAEDEGRKDIVVVIPTAELKEEFAENSRRLYKGWQIVFVQSKGTFFNYARSCNFALKHALKYKPRWILLSNNDMSETAGLDRLLSLLDAIPNKNVKVAFTKLKGHQRPSFMSTPRPLMGLYNALSGNAKKKAWILDRYGVKYHYYHTNNAIKEFFVNLLLYKPVRTFPVTGPFSVFSYDFVNSVGGKVFDETYINGIEDVELSLALCKDKENYTFIDFDVSTKGGGSLGKNLPRILRNMSNFVYLDYKMENGKIDW